MAMQITRETCSTIWESPIIHSELLQSDPSTKIKGAGGYRERFFRVLHH